MRALAEIKHEWNEFKHDHPGERFRNHRERMKDKPKSHSAIAVGLGVVQVAGGVVLLFVPGPGLLLIASGVALVGSHSKRLSAALDRAEPKLRRAGRRTRRNWKALSGQVKLGVIVSLAALAAAACLFMWKFVVSAYLLG